MEAILQVDLADTQHDRLFAFEDDFVTDLRCIPMAVRLKLDRVGIKMSLKQWAWADAASRQRLLKAPCSQPHEVMAFEKLLRAVITQCEAGPVKLLSAASVPYIHRTRTPDTVVGQCARDGLVPPDGASWSKLSTLEKFVLVKLSRDSHDNLNFPAAFSEIINGVVQPGRKSRRRAVSA